jgi:sporulation protein YlmC with PRC-barrel domain
VRTRLDPRKLVGRDLLDHQGSRIGTVRAVQLDATTGEPAWLAVSTAWTGSHVSLVPLTGVWATNDHLVSRWDAHTVKQAPHLGTGGPLRADEELALYRHYGQEWSESLDHGTS